MTSFEETKRNKNLLRVAAEIAGKGAKRGEMGVDEIEVIRTNGAERQVNQPAQEVDLEPQMAVYEEVEIFANIVLQRLMSLEESLDFELEDDNLDYAIDKIMDELLDEQTAFYPGAGQMPRNLPISPPGEDTNLRSHHADKIGQDMRSKPGGGDSAGGEDDAVWRRRKKAGLSTNLSDIRRTADRERGERQVKERQAARERRYEYEDQQEPVSKTSQQRITTALRRNKDLFAGKSPDEVEEIVRNTDFGY